MSSNLQVPLVPGDIPRYLREIFPMTDLLKARQGREGPALIEYQGIYRVITHLETIAKRQEEQKE